MFTLSRTLRRIALIVMLTCSQLVTWAQSPQVDDQLVNTVIVFSLLPFLVAFAFLFFIFYRQKRESDLRRLIAETEMKALRAQMNPHFLFNSLNSIYL
ncbi:MAG: histidine kinase, partial [Flavobacteriales bacterium]